MSAAFLLSLRHIGCDHGVPADPTATWLSRRRPGFPDGDPVIPTATRLTRRPLDQHNDILAVGISTSLLTRRRPGYSDGDPVFPTATRFSRPRPGYPDGDPADPSASRPAQRHPGCRLLDVPADPTATGYSDGDPVFPTATRFSRPRIGFPDRDPAVDQHNGILAVGFSTSLLTRRRPVIPTATRFSRRRPGFRDPVFPTATRLTRRHLDQHNGILAVGFSTSLLTRRRPGYSDGDPVFPQRSCPRPDDGVLAVFRPCRQCPGVCLLDVSHCLLFPLVFFSAGPLLQFIRPPFVTLLSILDTGTNCNELGGRPAPAGFRRDWRRLVITQIRPGFHIDLKGPSASFYTNQYHHDPTLFSLCLTI